MARAVVAALAKAADIPESMMRGPTDEEHASDLVIELIKGADSIFDGNSEFMLKNVRSNVAALAPTAHELLDAATDDVALRGYLVDLAAAYPRDELSPDPKTLLALAGIKSIERRLVHYSAFIKSATTKAMHVGERVSLLIERIQRAERLTSADRSSISIAPASNDGARTEPYGGAGRVNMQQLARVRLVLGSGPG